MSFLCPNGLEELFILQEICWIAWHEKEPAQQQQQQQQQQSFSTIKCALSNSFRHGISDQKAAFLVDFPLCPNVPPIIFFYLYCRLAISE